MKHRNHRTPLILATLVLGASFSFSQLSNGQTPERTIDFPDIPGFLTLKCDFHMHTVFSDGSVWTDIRVREAIMDGLDAISITDHIEYQPHWKEIAHEDRNRGFELAKDVASGSDLIVINGTEITRDMPPGHFNAIFLQDVNKLDQENVMDVFREARSQGAFVFWNHPHWTSQQPDGIATLTDQHQELFSEGLVNGVEIYNEYTYSDEALQIALDHNLTLIGNSDIHGLIDWQFNVAEGGHRPVTLVFAREKTAESIKEALEQRRTAVWFDNTLVGSTETLVPLIRHSLDINRMGKTPVQKVVIQNNSDADYILENRSAYTFHDKASVFMLKAHEETRIRVKTVEVLDSFQLRFSVLNAFTAPGVHPEIYLEIE